MSVLTPDFYNGSDKSLYL